MSESFARDLFEELAFDMVDQLHVGQDLYLSSEELAVEACDRLRLLRRRGLSFREPNGHYTVTRVY